MRVLDMQILRYGIGLAVGISSINKISFWGTTGYEKGIGFYSRPQCIIRIKRIRITAELFVG